MVKYLTLSVVLLAVAGAVTALAIWKGLHSFAFAWISNMVLMLGVFYVTESVKPRLAAGYFDSQKWEDEGRIYRWFGINGFRKLLVWIGWEKVTQAANPVKKGLDGLRHLERGTRKSEFGHAVLFVLMAVLALYVGVAQGLKQARWLVLLNVVLHAYPVMLQRFNRPRLQKAISKFSDRAAVRHR